MTTLFFSTDEVFSLPFETTTNMQCAKFQTACAHPPLLEQWLTSWTKCAKVLLPPVVLGVAKGIAMAFLNFYHLKNIFYND